MFTATVAVKIAQRLFSRQKSPYLDFSYHWLFIPWSIRTIAWSPALSSVRRETVHTNNDVESWHYRLNIKARRGQLDVYQLAPRLTQEVQFMMMLTVLLLEQCLIIIIIIIISKFITRHVCLQKAAEALEKRWRKRHYKSNVAAIMTQYTAGFMTSGIVVTRRK